MRSASCDTKTDRNDVLQAKMKKELAEYLEGEREKIRAKGITVYGSFSGSASVLTQKPYSRLRSSESMFRMSVPECYQNGLRTWSWRWSCREVN